jgi:hypothetical protein
MVVKWMHRWVAKLMHTWVAKWVDGQMNTWKTGWMDEQRGGRLEWMEGKMFGHDGRMHPYVDKCVRNAQLDEL